ncbi:MAG: prenyltransferase [Candidatus Kapabacteria bacterium]|nr:prenyltransferase [Candidatus Kapabacteria bacterium]
MNVYLYKIYFWYKNSRPRALPQSIIPIFIAIAYASHKPGFSIPMSVLAIIGVVFAHLGANLFDDYFDNKKSKSDLRERLKHQGFRARIAKCPYLTSGKATEKELLTVASLFFIIGGIISIIIYLNRGEVILYFLLMTLILSLSYSASPVKLSYRGFGELIIAFMFGPLSMTGVYYSACGEINWSLLYVFIPIGFLVMNIIFVHSIMDMVPDKHVGKVTLAVIINNNYINLGLLILINLLPYIIIITGITLNIFQIYYFAVLLILPMSISLIYLMIHYIKDPNRKFTSIFLLGVTKDYKLSQRLGNEWFMLRWLLARNITIFFSFIIIILAIIFK